MGPPSADLCEVLADLALAGYGVYTLRALHRVAPESVKQAVALRNAAALVAECLRKQFNSP